MFARRRRPAVRRRRIVRKKRTTRITRSLRGNANPNYSTITSSIQLLNNDAPPDTPLSYGLTFGSQVRLTDYVRAVAMASLFQEYKILKVKYTLKPAYNVYQASNDAPGLPHKVAQLPEMYYMIDKSGSLTTSILASGSSFRQMGAKPYKFTSNKVVSFTPCVNLQSSDELPAIVKSAPWISTSNDAISHLGFWFRADASNTLNNNFYTAECEVLVAFRRPRPTSS